MDLKNSASPNSLKIQALALKEEGLSNREISEELGVPDSTVSIWLKRLKKEENRGRLAEVVEVDAAVVREMGEEIKKKTPDVLKKEVDRVVDGVVGLQVLDEKFREVSMALLDKLSAVLSDDLTIKEMETVGKTIAGMYSAIFSKNVTNVNVLNSTTISTEKREIFKSSLKS